MFNKKNYKDLINTSNELLLAALEVIEAHGLENEFADKYLHRDGLSRISFRNEFEFAKNQALKKRY